MTIHRSTIDESVIYTPEQIDALALSACETVVAEPGKVTPYDVEAYQRVERRAVPTGQYPRYDPPMPDEQLIEQPLPSSCIGTRPYHLRIGGFRRDGIFGPDEAAGMLADAGVAFADSLGQGLFEHLVLCRKYGVTPVFEAPAAGFPYPFLQCELTVFEQNYRQQVAEFAEWIRRAEAVYGHPILKQPGQPWILWSLYSPLALFMLSSARRPEQTARELHAASGASRLEPNPKLPTERAAQRKAWAFIRRRHMEVSAIMAAVLREVIAPDAILIGNSHTLPVVDYEMLGQIYDHPGVAVRSGYLDDEQLREPNIAYSMRLFADLAGKTPIASVRINATAAGTRFIPGPNAVRQWCNTAVRHGVAGFYFWPVDYPSMEGQYYGAMCGNTDPSAYGRQRWDAMLGVFRSIAGARCFRPPQARVGILVPYDVLDLKDWRAVMDAFVTLEKARVFSQLVSDRSVERNGDALDHFEAVTVPACPFVSNSLADRLYRFVHRGGRLIVMDPEALRYDPDGTERPPFAGPEHPPARTSGAATHTIGQGQLCQIHDLEPDLHLQAIETNEWIYRVNAGNVRDLTGTIKGRFARAPEPGVQLRHYMYEHSSSAIIPHLHQPCDFPTESEQETN